MSRHLWAVLLAGGDGVRLRGLTARIVGDHRPKQFCPIVGSERLLRETRSRLDPLFSGDFLELVCSAVPDVVLSITRALADNDLETTYARLPSVDFSRDILSQQAKRLLVLRNSGSGWADLGSPDRVLGLLAKNVNQPAWFRQTQSFSPQVRSF
jgi:mannose-1-phosphate guanylyltransferase